METPSTARMADELQSIHEFQREVQDAEELEATGGSDMSLVLVTPPATKEPPTQPATKRPSSQAVDEHKQAHKKAKVDVQYTRLTRKRKPGPALKSPFRPTDVRGTDFQRWLDADADDT